MGCDLVTWIKNPLSIWTGNTMDAGGGLLVQDSTIIELVPTGSKPVLSYDVIFDASELVIIPGLINCHHHFYQTLTRAFPPALNKELFDWLKQLYPVWAGLDEEAIALSTRLAVCELMLSGCTTVSDHHYLFHSDITSAIDIQIQACEALGVRAILTRGSMSLGKSAGGLPPDNVVQPDEVILRESERLLTFVNNKVDKSFINVALAPCSPFSVTPQLMRDSAELARNYGALLHTHLCETEDENQFCLDTFGMRPVDYLEHVHWLANDVWLAHGIYFNEEEITRLGKAGVSVSHCPSSNMVLASGLCPVLALEAAGSAVGLGVDGSASNDCSNLIQEVRQAFLLQRLKYGAQHVSHTDALRWGTQGGAKLFHREDIGELAVGKQADLACFKLDELRFSGHGDPLAALVLCGAHQVEFLMVGGQWRVYDGDILGVDMDELRFSHQAAANKLAAKFLNM